MPRRRPEPNTARLHAILNSTALVIFLVDFCAYWFHPRSAERTVSRSRQLTTAAHGVSGHDRVHYY